MNIKGGLKKNRNKINHTHFIQKTIPSHRFFKILSWISLQVKNIFYEKMTVIREDLYKKTEQYNQHYRKLNI